MNTKPLNKEPLNSGAATESDPNSELWANADDSVGLHVVRTDAGIGNIAIMLRDRNGDDAIILGVTAAAGSNSYLLFRAEPTPPGAAWPPPRKYTRPVGSATLIQIAPNELSLTVENFSPEGATVSPMPPPVTMTFVLGRITV